MKSTKTESYASTRKKSCLLFLCHQQDIKIGLMIMKTKTGKQQKFSRKVQESEEAN